MSITEELRTKIEELRTKRAEKIMEARGLVEKAKEKNDPGAFDDKGHKTLMEEINGFSRMISSLQAQLQIEEEEERSAGRKTYETPGGEGHAGGRNEPEGFESFGQFLWAVRDAAVRPHMPDRRLLEAEERAATGQSVGVPSEGGFLVEKQTSRDLLQKTFELGTVLGKCQRIAIGPGSNGFKWMALEDDSRATGSRWGGVRAFWLNEAADKTAAKIKMRVREITVQKMAALCYVTDEILADAVAMESWIRQLFPKEFAFETENALFSGTGVGQPLGILQCPALITVAKESAQAAATVKYENILKMWSRLYGPLRQNAVWYINQEVEPQLSTMALTIGDGGVPVYMPAGGASTTQYSTLFGRPVVPVEYCSGLGTVGDVVLADMSQYFLIDKGGIETASSMHVRFLNDETVYRFVYKINGQPWWENPLTPFKGTTTYSPFVTLETRE